LVEEFTDAPGARKRALEGDADAAFFFARQDAILAGEADARFEAIEMDMSLLE